MPRKKKEPVDPNSLDRETVLFYRGRHTAFPNAHFYVTKDTNKEVTFKRKLHKIHKIGLGYPVTITQNGRSFGTMSRVKLEEIEVWHDKKEIAEWVRMDELVANELKRQAEAAGLRTKARKLAQQIKDEYKRANSFDKRDIIASFMEELES